MKKSKSHYFLPDSFTPWIAVFLFIASFSIKAADNIEYSRFEKIYNTLEMETLDHKKIKLKDLGSQVVVVNFWASWCIPCLEEMPSLVKLASKYKKEELAVVAINTDENDQLKNIAKTKKKLALPDSFIIVPDNKFKIADEFKFSAIPVTVIFKNGKTKFFKNGPVDFQKVPLDLW